MVELCLAIQHSCQLQVRMISTSTYLRDILMHLNQTCFATLSPSSMLGTTPKQHLVVYANTNSILKNNMILRGILNKYYWNFVLGYIQDLWLPYVHICGYTCIILNGLTYKPAEYLTSIGRIFPSPERTS